MYRCVREILVLYNGCLVLVLVLHVQLALAGDPASLLAQEGRSGRAAPVPELPVRRRRPVALGDELEWSAESSVTVSRRSSLHFNIVLSLPRAHYSLLQRFCL